MYKKAAQGYLEVKTTTKVRADEEDSSPDFSTEKPQVFIGKTNAQTKFDQKEWEDRVRRYSSIFAKYPTLKIPRSCCWCRIRPGTSYPRRVPAWWTRAR